jgi:predicted permease
MMSRVNRLIAGLVALLRRRRTDQELDAELGAYLDASIEQKVHDGLSREAATRAARIELGSLDAVKERTRDVGWQTHVESMWRDVRYAARALRRSPTFAVVAALILTLGIGANTAIFSVVNAVWLRPLPVDRPGELISLSVLSADGNDALFSYAAFRQFATEATSAADPIAASSARPDAISIDGPPEPVVYKWVSGSYFTTLGVHAALGRTLMDSDDRLPRGLAIAVLSDAYWARRFGRSAAVLGRTFRFKGAAFTIVGVAESPFRGETAGEAPDVWMPLTSQPGAPPWVWSGHSTTWLRLLARRKPGVPLDQARAGLESVYGRIRTDTAAGERNEYRKVVLESRLQVREASAGSPILRDRLSAPLLILMAIVGLVLLTACANVATLMLARGGARRRQTAVCLAIGAGRWRLVRQGFVEALLLAALGGAAGLLLAAWGTRVLATLMSGAFPVAIDATPDLRVLGFAILVSFGTAVVFGLLPALRAAGIDPLPDLKVGGAGTRGAMRIPLGRSLVVAQIAVSLVLLLVAGLFTRSLLKLKDIDTGFDPDRVLLLQMTPPLDEHADPTLYQRLLAQAGRVRGVDAASLSASGAFNRGMWGNTIAVEGLPPSPEVTPRTFANAVSAQYFAVMRIAVLRGRAFTDADRSTGPRVAVVNQTFARRFLGDANPIGRRVAFCAGDPCASAPQAMMEIVGMAEDAKYADLREGNRPMLYVPFTQHDQTLRELEVRTTGNPALSAATLRRELARVDPRLASVEVTELREQVDASLLAERLTAKLSATFGLLALALAAVGLYGVIAYMTLQRTAEIGLRIALGARRRQVRRLVLGDIFRLVLVGVVLGLPGGLAGARLLEPELYGVAPTDPLATTAALVTLVVAALLAGYLPARRAAAVDPLIALRAE